MSSGANGHAARHVGPSEAETQHMLERVGYPSLDALTDAAIPAAVRTGSPLDLPDPLDEHDVLVTLRSLGRRNRQMVSMIGLGYYDTVTPAVVVRRLLESPGWYTAYTPYQPEIAQGRLEALLNFQTVVAELTDLPVANASLLDESTAVAEAMTLMRRAARGLARTSETVLVDADCLPQTIAVLQTRAEPLGIKVQVCDLREALPEVSFFGVIAQYPGASGAVRDLTGAIEQAHQRGALVSVAADLLALALLVPPGAMGADIAVGTSQRLGVPLGYGGPHAGYIAVRNGLERSLPGRLVGTSTDAAGRPAQRLALQTREQHIRRERATSNICTAQALLAITSAMYVSWHGPDGLRRIAERVHRRAGEVRAGLAAGGVAVLTEHFFDTVLAHVPGEAASVLRRAAAEGINVGLVDQDHVRIACDEVTTPQHVASVLRAFGLDPAADGDVIEALPSRLLRTDEYLQHDAFTKHHSETAMLRYLRSLADKDYALDRGMIPLGSCTMKLNATTAMEPITWPAFAGIHPFAPAGQAHGYRDLIDQLAGWLAEITGFAAVSLQPNAGSQGELAGLLAIAAYHRSRGQTDRNLCLIPASAHGTNAASAVMAGLAVEVVATAADGTVDLADLQATIDRAPDRVAAVMLTYPSTHGVYEAGVTDIVAAAHACGAQVYIDGANMNALLGLARPAEIGADVCHLNLHKTFGIPHGGGGPGVGPIGVAEHLIPYLPHHPLDPFVDAPAAAVGPVAAAPYGSAGVLPISWAFIAMLGADGLRRSAQTAVLAANYVAQRLGEHFPVLFTGEQGLVAHECILDLRPATAAAGLTVDDVAKRLIDYGFHAPTMSFPVPGTFMVEPTESEDLAELDRFCDAMIAIKAELDAVAEGRWPTDDNPLSNAPHTAEMLVSQWRHPYEASIAVYPAGEWQRGDKYWPPVRRVDNAYGDRNLVCACPDPSAYSSVTTA